MARSDARWGAARFWRDAEVDFAGIMHRLLGVSPANTIAVRQVVEPKAAAFAAANANLADLEAIVAARQAAVDAIGSSRSSNATRRSTS